MGTLLASGSITIFDQNDAIISGVQPVSPTVDALWIDTSVTPNMLKKYNGTTWDPVSQLDPNIVNNIGAIQSTLNNMADDSKLDFKDRQKLKENIAEIIGNLLGDTEAMPTVTVLDSGTEGSFSRNRRAARNAGILTTETNYVALTNAYNTLRTYLSTHTPKSWDTSIANKDAVIQVTKATFRQHWLNYYNAELALAESATNFLSTGLNTLKDTTIPALQDKVLSEAEKTAIRSSLMLTQKEKKDIDAVYTAYNTNASLLNKTVITTPYTAYTTAYNETITAINNILAVATGTTIAPALITTVNTKFTNYADKLALLRAALQTAQKTIETKIATDADNNLSTELANYVTALDLSKLQDQVDGSITTYFGSVEPTMSNVPANSWTTTTLKDVHLGDLYYDDITGYSYRFSKKETVYSWIRITDSDITLALGMASKAQDTADGKRRMFVSTPTPPYDIGDLWAGGGTSDLMKALVNKATGTYLASDWGKAVKYTDDTTATAAQQAAIAAKGVADGAAQNATTANNLLSDISSDSKLTAAEKSSLKVQWDSIVSEFEKNKASAAKQSISTTAYHNAYTSLSGTIGTHLNDANLKVTTTINGTTLRAAFKAYYDQRQVLLDGITDSLNQKSIDLGIELGEVTSDNKLPVITGNPIYTAKADDAVVHVEVDGKSEQTVVEGNPNILIGDTLAERTIKNSTTSENHIIYNNGVSSGVILSPNTVYTLSAEYSATNNVKNVDFFFVSAVGQHKSLTLLPNTNGEFVYKTFTFTTGDNANQVGEIRFDNNGSADGKESVLKTRNVKLEKGSTATPIPTPSPDYPSEINSLDKSFDIVSSVGGRNVIPNTAKIKVTDYSDLASELSFVNGWTEMDIRNGLGSEILSNNFYTIEPDTLYTESMIVETDGEYAYSTLTFFDNAGGHLQTSTTAIKIASNKWLVYGTQKTRTNQKLMRFPDFNGFKINGGTYAKFGNFKLEKGEYSLYAQAPEDIPYDTQSSTLYKTNILLSEPLRSVGDVKDRLFLDSDGLWKVERNVGEKVFNGTESGWGNPDTASTNTLRFFNAIGDFVSGLPIGDYIDKSYSSHFKNIKNYTPDVEGIFFNYSKQMYIRINKSRLTSNTLGAFTSWLSANPMTVVYVKNPTIETLSAEQQTKLNNIQSFKGNNYVYTLANVEPNLNAQFKSTAFYRYKSNLSTINNLRQSMDATKDVNLGMLIGYSSFTVQTANSLYFCGLKTNETTFNEEVADIDGSIFNRQTKETIVVPKQSISLAGVPAGTSGYIIWDNTSKKLHFTYYTSVMGAESKTSSSWKNQTGAVINLTDSVYVIGEIQVS